MVLGAPSSASSLLGPMLSRPTLRLELLGRFLGEEASLGASKPHPVCAESSRFCRAPGGWGIPQGLTLLLSLRLGLTVTLR